MKEKDYNGILKEIETFSRDLGVSIYGITFGYKDIVYSNANVNKHRDFDLLTDEEKERFYKITSKYALLRDKELEKNGFYIISSFPCLGAKRVCQGQTA